MHLVYIATSTLASEYRHACNLMSEAAPKVNRLLIKDKQDTFCSSIKQKINSKKDYDKIWNIIYQIGADMKEREFVVGNNDIQQEDCVHNGIEAVFRIYTISKELGPNIIRKFKQMVVGWPMFITESFINRCTVQYELQQYQKAWLDYHHPKGHGGKPGPFIENKQATDPLQVSNAIKEFQGIIQLLDTQLPDQGLLIRFLQPQPSFGLVLPTNEAIDIRPTEQQEYMTFRVSGELVCSSLLSLASITPLSRETWGNESTKLTTMATRGWDTSRFHSISFVFPDQHLASMAQLEGTDIEGFVSRPRCFYSLCAEFKFCQSLDNIDFSFVDGVDSPFTAKIGTLQLTLIPWLMIER